jgi:D-alanyl-D-alanine carboxypeptidase/D-alanyl-D-alanine-endopeptidase (penicillin-binding protein 4)
MPLSLKELHFWSSLLTTATYKRPSRTLARFLSILLLITFVFVETMVLARTVDSQTLISKGGYLVAGRTPPLGFQENQPFIPASTLKILTSLAAIAELGEDYRFTTNFYLDTDNNLYIKGFGDPFLTSEIVADIALHLRQLGITELNSIFLDQSSFALGNERADAANSMNPYDAPNGALVVNFNALPLHITESGNISSGEPQTPLLPLMEEVAASLPAGFHRVNVAAIVAKPDSSLSLRYTGELFTAQFLASGIAVKKGFSAATATPELSLIYSYISQQSLAEIIEACLKYSNNFIANQLFLACGMNVYGAPATWEKSRRFMDNYLQENFDDHSQAAVVNEGSGLSRKNRLSPSLLVAILDQFKPYAHLLPEKDSLPVKSGTLDGVYCYAGYFRDGKRLSSFALLLNQNENNRDRLLKILKQKYLQQLND